MDSNMQEAIDIVSKLIRNIKISEKYNKELYFSLITNTYVYSNVENLLESFQMDLYLNDKEGAFVSPKPGNTAFGYKNSELKSELSLKSNGELYLSYFVIYNLISAFYIQSNYRTEVEYMTTKSLCDRVEKRLKGLSDNNDLPLEYESSFKNMYSIWQGMPLAPTKDKENINFSEKRGQNKIAFVNRTLDFLEKQELVIKDKHTERYYITGKFECMIEQFFDDSNTNSMLIELLNKEIEEHGNVSNGVDVKKDNYEYKEGGNI